jgi:hypothetical protein
MVILMMDIVSYKFIKWDWKHSVTLPSSSYQLPTTTSMMPPLIINQCMQIVTHLRIRILISIDDISKNSNRNKKYNNQPSAMIHPQHSLHHKNSPPYLLLIKHLLRIHLSMILINNNSTLKNMRTIQWMSCIEHLVEFLSNFYSSSTLANKIWTIV